MKKLKLDPEALTVETFEARDYPPPVAALNTGGCPDTVTVLGTDGCPDTYQTTGYWICAADCGTTGCISDVEAC